MIAELLLLVGLGWALNVLVAVPYYFCVLRHPDREDDDEVARDELIGTIGLCAIPYVHFLMIALLLIAAALYRDREDDEGDDEERR